MKKKIKPTDGLGPYEIKRIRSALRLVWHRSLARKLVVKRCTGEDGFARCERCGTTTPQLKVDHIVPCGEVDANFIGRLFCPSNQLQGWCHPCHREKTRQERHSARLMRNLKGYLD